MGRPPNSGGPAFRFTANEVAEMEACLQESNLTVPSREVLYSLAEKFSTSADRVGKIMVQPKQVWNWFQNRRYAHKAKLIKTPGKLSVSPMPRDDSVPMRNVSHTAPVHSGRSALDNPHHMEFEAKSARDGAWYDVATFISHRLFNTHDPEVRVRFAGFGAEEDEWVNVRKHVRLRSLPCEASECVAVLAGDLILCFQEGKDQALYFDAHVLDAQRRRHDVRGCRCRFLVRYDHDQSEEIVPLRKVCRQPETDYRLQLLHASKDLAPMELKNAGNVSSVNNTSTAKDISSLAEKTRTQCKVESNADEVVMMSAPPQDRQPTTTSVTKDERTNDVDMKDCDAQVGDAPLTMKAATSTSSGAAANVGNMPQ